MLRFFTLPIIVATLCFTNAQCHADFIPGVTATTDMGMSSPSNGPVKILDGSGLSSFDENAIHSNSLADMWLSRVGGSSVNGLNGYLQFDLGSAQILDTMHVWQFSQDGRSDRRVTSFDVESSTDGINFVSVLGAQSLPDAPVTGTVAVDYSLAGVNAQYIRMNILANGGSRSFVGLSEVQFTAAVPEPSSALILLGTGLAGLVLLRRKV